MTETFALAALWLSLAVVATILANHLKVSMALTEICVGVAAGYVADRFFGPNAMGANVDWLKFLAASGAVLLTFLAGAELEPTVLRAKWKEVTAVGLFGFFAPFLGCTAVAYYLMGWEPRASWLAGVALSTTSMAVVYAVMLDTKMNRTEFGKGILGACFINDLGTVIALGVIFAPFTMKTLIFGGVCVIVIGLLPFLTNWITRHYAHRTAAIRAKWVLLVLFGLGALALWSESEAVLPAYIAGMVLAGAAAEDRLWVRRMRTLTIGFLTPFYFIRAGSLVSLPAVVTGPLVFSLLLGAKVVSKVFGLYPLVAKFRRERNERWYYTLLMSTGLTFGTISALYGFAHGIVSREQYSFLVAAVIASAVVPTVIATLAFLPRHLIPAPSADTQISQPAEVCAADLQTNGNGNGLSDE
jgi:glutathione-regulated potassium-efflux system ancillary protein KefC